MVPLKNGLGAENSNGIEQLIFTFEIKNVSIKSD